MLKLLVPVGRGATGGSDSNGSVEVMFMVLGTVAATFQQASPELTVTLYPVPALSALGVPVLPLDAPGAAVSPGTSNCSFTNEPALTLIAGLVLVILVPSLRSVAVTVRKPEVLSVTLE